MIVLGIDPGLANVGFGAVDLKHSRLSVIVSGTITTNPRMHFERRIYLIARKVQYLIQATEPDIVVMEEFIPFKFRGRHRMSMSGIDKVSGALIYVVQREKVELLIARPNVWMRSLLGLTKTAKFSKLKIQRFVDRKLKIQTRVEHEAEALGMALYYLKQRGKI